MVEDLRGQRRAEEGEQRPMRSSAMGSIPILVDPSTRRAGMKLYACGHCRCPHDEVRPFPAFEFNLDDGWAGPRIYGRGPMCTCSRGNQAWPSHGTRLSGRDLRYRTPAWPIRSTVKMLSVYCVLRQMEVFEPMAEIGSLVGFWCFDWPKLQWRSSSSRLSTEHCGA